MANNYHNARKTSLVKYPIASGTVAEIGDLAYEASNAILPFLSLTDAVGEEDNQAQAAQQFVGVFTNASASGSTDPVLIETSGEMEYEFTVVSATYRIGSFLGASEATGTTVSSQTLEAVTSQDIALFVVTNDDASARTTVRCRQIRGAYASLPVRPDVSTATLTADLVLTFDSPKLQFLDPGGSARNVDLPPVEESAGLEFKVANTADAAEALTVRLTGGGATIAALAQDEHGFFFSNGVIWVGTANTET